MARPKTSTDLVPISLYIESKDKEELESQGISMTKFVRQAIKAFKDKKFKYIFKEVKKQ